jgi:Rhomboid family
MEQLLARLERRFGRYAIHNLISVVVGGMAIVWVLSLLKPEFQDRLWLDIPAVRHGQVWRLVTFLFIPPPSKPMWVIINLYFTWWVGSSLEQRWGPFKFNAYYLLGALGTVVAAVIAGPATNFWLDASLFLAFATVFPDVTILLFFLIPVRVKWLGIVAALFMAYAAATQGWGARGSIAASMVNYLVFFGEHWYAVLRDRGTVSRQKVRRESVRPAPGGLRPGPGGRIPGPMPDGRPVFGERVCAVCGAREAEGADIRVCSCEKCGGQQRSLCLVHARNH